VERESRITQQRYIGDAECRYVGSHKAGKSCSINADNVFHNVIAVISSLLSLCIV
jgi:hypothetical protein